MTVTASRPLVFSMLLHGAAVGALVFLMLRTSREPAAVPQPFEIFPAPVVPSQTQSSTPSANPAVTVKLPAVVAPVPQPPARVVEDEVDEPVRTPPVRTSVAPTERPPARTTLKEFQRSRPSTVTQSVVSGPPVASQPKRINLDEVLGASGKAGTKPVVAADPAREGDYWDLFLTKLRDAHEKPAGLEDGLQVRVEFVLRADGTLGDVRVLGSSGDAAFDASVVAAFRRVRGLGNPPAGKVGVNQITFRTRAE